MIVVHHLEDSRSQRVLWLLEELRVAYEVRRYDRDPVTMLAPQSLKDVHPLGKSPVIEEEGVVVAETGAIFEYVLDTHGADRLRPARGTPAGRAFTYWMHYAEGSAMPMLVMKLVFQRLPSNAPRLARPLVRAVAGRAQQGFLDPQLATHIRFWDDSLKSGDGWFAGGAFSAADIMMSFPLEAAVKRAGAGGYEAVRDFLERIHARPAYQKALSAGGPYSYA